MQQLDFEGNDRLLLAVAPRLASLPFRDFTVTSSCVRMTYKLCIIIIIGLLLIYYRFTVIVDSREVIHTGSRRERKSDPYEPLIDPGVLFSDQSVVAALDIPPFLK